MPDTHAIAKLAAEAASLRGQIAVVSKQGMPGLMLSVHIDKLNLFLNALDAAGARMKELGDAATERFDRLNERIAELAGELETARHERDETRAIVRDTLWMARRYADGRKTYAASLYNDAARKALAAGIVKDDQREPVFAHDGMGAGFAALSHDEQDNAARYAGSLTAAEACAAKLRETVERLCEVIGPFDRFTQSMKQLGHDAGVKHLVRQLTPNDFRRAAAERTRAVAEAGEGRADEA